jgi:hypothetical protein
VSVLRAGHFGLRAHDQGTDARKHRFVQVSSYRMDFFVSGCRCSNRAAAPPRGQRRPGAAPGPARPAAGGYNQSP